MELPQKELQLGENKSLSVYMCKMCFQDDQEESRRQLKNLGTLSMKLGHTPLVWR